MTDDMMARLREMAEPAMDQGVIPVRRKIIHAALLAAVRMGMEEAAKIAHDVALDNVEYRSRAAGALQAEEAIRAAMLKEATDDNSH